MYTKIIFALLIGLSTHSTQCMLGVSPKEAEHNKGVFDPRKAMRGEHRAKRAVGLRFNKTVKQQEKIAAELRNARAARAKNSRALKNANKPRAHIKDYSTEYEYSSAAYAACSDASNTSHRDGTSSSDTPHLRAPRAEPSCLETTGYAAATLIIAALASPVAQKAFEAFAAEMVALNNSTN